MDKIDKEMRRILLKPLSSRKAPLKRVDLSDALVKLDERTAGENVLQQNRDLYLEKRDDLKKWKDPARAGRFIALSMILYASRRISKHEYVFYACAASEGVHEGRLQDGHYEDVLAPISKAIEQVERDHGLKGNEYWPRGQGPSEHTRLNQLYEKTTDAKFVETLREFRLVDLAELFETDRAEFKRLRERGRRALFHRDEYFLTLQDVVVQYESEAGKAASSGAYAAAIALLGAAIEGVLLLRCLRSPRKAMRCAEKLPKGKRSGKASSPDSWRFETLIEVCQAAGWFRPIESTLAIYNPAGLAHLLRTMRNRVHPGRIAKENPWGETTERDYRDAEAIYSVVAVALGKSRQSP